MSPWAGRAGWLLVGGVGYIVQLRLRHGLAEKRESRLRYWVWSMTKPPRHLGLGPCCGEPVCG